MMEHSIEIKHKIRPVTISRKYLYVCVCVCVCVYIYIWTRKLGTTTDIFDKIQKEAPWSTLHKHRLSNKPRTTRSVVSSTLWKPHNGNNNPKWNRKFAWKFRLINSSVDILLSSIRDYPKWRHQRQELNDGVPARRLSSSTQLLPRAQLPLPLSDRRMVVSLLVWYFYKITLDGGRHRHHYSNAGFTATYYEQQYPTRVIRNACFCYFQKWRIILLSC